ncbi:Dual specificity protein phosphatase 12 [Cytospora mali]|uniref:protein-tyrosine-phosphatase n=1 Tax=Cytospora mali TaxID=578113 RepID=A0A194W001_CYTMA|nr:Dual specificity protein phosphatase 12 [Valsa mali]
MAAPVSSAWLNLFEESQAPDAESSLESYEALDKLDAFPSLSFLKDLIWEEIRKWVANNTDPMSAVRHEDFDGPGRVFLGGMNHALNDDTLREHNITAVISIHPRDQLAWHPTNTSYGLRRFQVSESSCPVQYHLMIPLEDKSNADLMEYFGQTYDFMQSHLHEGRNVLVHCKSGRSRSVAVVIAYLQRKYYETTIRPHSLPLEEALGKMVSYREAVTESIRYQRLPVSIIMERFETLLELYDLLLLGHPSYAQERVDGFPEPSAGEQKTAGSQQMASSQATASQSTISQAPSSQTSGFETMGSQSSAGRKRVKKKGGAAILKISTAIVFFTHNQKPPVSVVERLFEINEDYFYEMEGSEHKGISYGESGHAHRGICAFYARFADEFGYELPSAVSLFSSETN